ncbi:zinc-binding alcohol dehydrogenase family protein [Gordonia aichiensis]|uniref:zinc-binding alcohol dehydrogenase family protein n=1 Tax=Gordonia aichiensis TaxID=36820 RepID=UPI003263E344
MRTAWRVGTPSPIDDGPLEMVREPVPDPGPGQVLLQTLACGVCRTDLHVTEGDLPVHRRRVVPGHEVVGRILALGPDTETEHRVGDTVGIPWLAHTCGLCRYCRAGHENLCPASKYTGWDADGGYADRVLASADYVLALPAGYSSEQLAPLLCAGIIGYRALRRADLPVGGTLGIYGFGGSAHLTAQVALAQGARLHVMTRDGAARDLALALGAASAQGADDPPPEPLDSAIVFAPVGDLVPVALAALRPGGTVALAGIHMTDTPPLNYQRHLFHEKTLRSVESNTRADAREFLDFAGAHRLTVQTTRYRLDQAPRALSDLAHGRFPGAAVLIP